MRRWLTLAICVVVMASSAGATAGDAALDLRRQGQAMLAQRNYQGALEAFRGADAINGNPDVGLEVGTTLIALGRLVEAQERLTRVSESPIRDYEPPSYGPSRAKAVQLVLELGERIPTVVVKLDDAPPDLSLKIDGASVALSDLATGHGIDAGEHTLVATAPGFVTERRTFAIRERDRRDIPLRLTRESGAAGPATGDVMMAVGFTVGGAGALLGAITGVLSLSAASDFQSACDASTRTCPASAQADQERALGLAHTSTVGFVIAGVGTAVGITGLVLVLTADDSVAIAPFASPSALGLAGRF
jgi:hypothetical protein